MAKNDPEASKQIQQLVKEMQGLDPKRFPGNPEVLAQMQAQVLNDVDRLEMELRRNVAAQQVRTGAPQTVSPGYQEAVAEYFRRLGKTQK